MPSLPWISYKMRLRWSLLACELGLMYLNGRKESVVLRLICDRGARYREGGETDTLIWISLAFAKYLESRQSGSSESISSSEIAEDRFPGIMLC